MADRPVNLRRARKQRERRAREAEAALNRTKHGLPKAERTRAQRERTRAEADLAGKRLEPADD